MSSPQRTMDHGPAPVGACTAPKPKAAAVASALFAMGKKRPAPPRPMAGLARSANVTPFNPSGLLATHSVLRGQVQAAQQSALAEATDQPEAQLAVHVVGGAPTDEQWAVLVTAGATAYVDGLRVLDDACVRPGDPLPRVLSSSRAEESSTRSVDGSSRISSFTFTELFAGLGGFAQALRPLGGRCVLASELSVEARLVYRANHNDNHEHLTCSTCAEEEGTAGVIPFGDVTELPDAAFGPHDILTAGFPCQSFCKAGEKLGLGDRRGALFHEVIRALRQGRPRGFLLENVSNITTLDGGATLEAILAELDAAGYHVRTKVLDAADFGVPQHRSRIYFLGGRKDLFPADGANTFAPRWPVPLPPHQRQSCDVLEEADAKTIESLRLTSTQWAQVRRTVSYRKRPSHRISQIPPRTNTSSSSVSIACESTEPSAVGESPGETNEMKRSAVARTMIASYKSHHAMYSEYVPLDGWTPPLNAAEKRRRSEEKDRHAEGAHVERVKDDDEEENAKGGQKDNGHEEVPGQECDHFLPDGRVPVRFYSRRECARIMGFPDSFSLDVQGVPPATLYHMLGNAVCPPVVALVAVALLDALNIQHR